MFKALVSFCFIFSYSTFAESDSIFKWKGNINSIVKTYIKVHDDFSDKMCTKGTEEKYWRLLKDYRSLGIYLPKVGDDIDRLAIKKNLKFFQKKINFIYFLKKKLIKEKDFPEVQTLFSELDKTVNYLLYLKKEFYEEVDLKKKNHILTLSRNELIRLKKQFTFIIKKIFFLKSFNFPNDFLKYRTAFDRVKGLKGNANKRKANERFFFRKIVEDGAFNPDHTYPDKFTRTAIDTLYLNLKKEKDFISENVRYDLSWIKKSVGRILKQGKAYQVKRLEEWYERTGKTRDFYKEIIKSAKNKEARFLVKKENEKTEELKKFVYKKQADVYNYWAKQSEMNKALFSLETILVHEVGVLDGDHGLERRSVANVVMNRFHDPFYSQLNKNQSIVKDLAPGSNPQSQKWLNTLFKTGEFSFTYHYIPAVRHIFCPDMSSRGRTIRKQNVRMALEELKKYDGSFQAFRYFSRISMLGKIDMSSVWRGYSKLPEMVGFKAKDQKILRSYYILGKYQYFYSFRDFRGVEHKVVSISDVTYSMRWESGNPVFFDYRNPHLFTYFSKKK